MGLQTEIALHLGATEVQQAFDGQDPPARIAAAWYSREQSNNLITIRNVYHREDGNHLVTTIQAVPLTFLQSTNDVLPLTVAANRREVFVASQQEAWARELTSYTDWGIPEAYEIVDCGLTQLEPHHARYAHILDGQEAENKITLQFYSEAQERTVTEMYDVCVLWRDLLDRWVDIFMEQLNSMNSQDYALNRTWIGSLMAYVQRGKEQHVRNEG